MVDIVKLAVALTFVTLVAGMAIGFTHARTAQRIEKQQVLAQQRALSKVFPEGVQIAERKAFSPLPDRYWVATRDTTLVGYAFEDSSRGYERDIKVLVGVDPQGTILGMTVLSQSETPGLGARVEEVAMTKYIWNPFSAKKQEDVAWFTRQFVGNDVHKDIDIRKGDEWHKLDDAMKGQLIESNAVTAIAGATVSTRAVAGAVSKRIPDYLAALTEPE